MAKAKKLRKCRGPYYVYELIDPRDHTVFYVGKGKGNRYLQHELEAQNAVFSYKCNKIRSIQRAGLYVKHRIVAYYVDEQEAYAAERERIKELGIENLTNATYGGAQYPPSKADVNTVIFEKYAAAFAKLYHWKKQGLRLTVLGIDMTDRITEIMDNIVKDAVGVLGEQSVIKHVLRYKPE